MAEDSRTSEGKRTPAGILLTAVGVLMIIIPLALSLFMLVPRLFGYSEYTVVTGSMEPELPVGSLVLVKSVEAEELEEGDIISYSKGPGDQAVITHRIIKNDRENGEIITKGDANQAEDLEPVKYDFVIGKVEKSFPGLGVPAQAAGTIPGKIALASVIIAGYLLTLAGARLRRGL